jgi:hypothetical protein
VSSLWYSLDDYIWPSSTCIKSDQKRSKAIKSDQKRSEAIRSDQKRSAQQRSKALKRDQTRSKALKRDQTRSKAIKSDHKRPKLRHQFYFAELIRHVQQISRQAYRASITHIYSPNGLYKHSQEEHLIYIQIKATNRTETVWINVSSRWTVNLCDPGPTWPNSVELPPILPHHFRHSSFHALQSLTTPDVGRP